MQTTVAVCFALALTACSALDPSVGPPYVTPPLTVDGGEGPDGDNDADPVDPGGVSFARDIRPLLLRTSDAAKALNVGRGCVPCHDGKAPTHTGASLSGFDISSLGELRKGGGSTRDKVIVPGDPDGSGMVRALRGLIGSNRMPKSGPYWEPGSEEMRLLTTWIAEGALGKSNE